MRLGEDDRWRAVGVLSRFGSISPELRLVGPMRTFSITAAKTTV
jgi:hypothetical protein